MRLENSKQLTPITVAGQKQWDLYNWALVSILKALKERNE